MAGSWPRWSNHAWRDRDASLSIGGWGFIFFMGVLAAFGLLAL